MSKINSVRLINMNYNNHAIKISDETFHMNGESTLMSLRNGGGKSVLVQMMMAPFVHKRYRDAKDRPFESYFTTGKPTFILVEWMLDQHAGYVLTGMMVRRNQSIDEEQSENLDIVNIISEYQEPCLTDIHHLPVVEKGKKEMVLKNFPACRQLFEGFKKDPHLKFFCYDMTNSAQSKQYFDKLAEYQIHYKEWETIIKKVNLEESGLSNLFSDCRDERGLVEKWFLDAVQSKLNKEKDRMGEFQSIIGKYAGLYKDSQSKFQRRDTIRLFKEESIRIEESALRYQQAEDMKKQQEGKIACFIRELQRVKEAAGTNLQNVRDELSEISRAAARIVYEKLSKEYYALSEEQKSCIINKEMILMEQDALDREQKEQEEKLHVLLCAKQQSAVTEEKGEWEQIRQKVLVYHRRNEDLEPERQFLGYGLRCHYEKALAENTDCLDKCRKQAEQIEKELLEKTEKIETFEREIRENAEREGALKSSVKSYDAAEEEYNSRYGEELARNIMGSYEPGALEIKAQVYRQEMEELVRQQGRRRREAEDTREKIRGLESSLDRQNRELLETEAEQREKEKLQKHYEEELACRANILKYLDMGEDEQFDTEKILRVSERKLREIARLRRDLEKEEDALEKEYQNLTLGKTLELPENLERELTDLGIHIVYGMEWLKKNGYSEKQNREMVRRHPFLPYALICSGRELEKLSEHGGEIFTSFPVPIIRREDLEAEKEAVPGGVISFKNVSFYVLFNENLLNEKKLALLVEELAQKIQHVKENIAIRDTEYSEYFERKEMIRNQAVSQKLYTENLEKLQNLENKTAELVQKLNETRQDLEETKERSKKLEEDIQKAVREIDHGKRKSEDFEKLCQLYETYQKEQEELDRCRKERERLFERKKLSAGQLEKLREQLKNTEFEQENLAKEESSLQECLRCYAAYKDKPAYEPDGEIRKLNIPGMEARFQAITASLSQELQELEAQEVKALKRYQKEEKELGRLCQKYRLEPGAWNGKEYNSKEESYLEVRLEDLQKKIENKKMLAGNEETKIQVLENSMQGKLERIQTECGKEEVMDQSDIQEKDFDAVKSQLDYQEKELQKQADAMMDSLQSYEENLTALAEYSNLEPEGEPDWDEDFSDLTRSELRDRKGSLIRDYREYTDQCRDGREQLERVLNQIVRMEAFADEYYQKPLEAMLELAGNAGYVLQQLHTTVQSYDDLIRKLEVDISVVEKERERIVELLEDYIRDVHESLGKIDANSTITVRQRPLKMLRIQMPEWEENAELYHIRLLDMIEEITKQGIAIYEKNENAQEYFGTQVTTKNLYDTVIGIGNVQVKLYKIEEQREYPITWAEVAKNSGGEGFLSAFVILSSLLYYMRKDDTDLFADHNEGKVLVMDNPFAQTNAAHLLRPLMDMAKKANTQLICLTGLGGESIYNRFDNIYVLNLVAANLRNGLQYLKIDHVKGRDQESMVVSQIEVVEQLELEF